MSDDSAAILLLCAGIGTARRQGPSAPLTNQEWTSLAEAIRKSQIERPGRLLNMSATEIGGVLALPPAKSERLASLLSRGGQLAMELDRWSSAGIWACTRADPEYPGALKRVLRRAAPAALFGIGDVGLLESRGPGLVVSPDAEGGERFGRAVGMAAAAVGLTLKTAGVAGPEAVGVEECMQGTGRAVVVGEPLERALRDRVRRESVMAGRLSVISTRAPGGRALPVGERIRLVAALCHALLVAPPRGAWGQTKSFMAGGAGPPVFVWTNGEITSGVSSLLRRGARLVPAGSGAPEGELGDWLRWAVSAQALDHPPIDRARPEGIQGATMYDQFLEALGGQQKPLTPAEAAAELGLLEEQAQIWLDMAVRDGLARKASGRYRVVGQASLLPLIDIDRGR